MIDKINKGTGVEKREKEEKKKIHEQFGIASGILNTRNLLLAPITNVINQSDKVWEVVARGGHPLGLIEYRLTHEKRDKRNLKILLVKSLENNFIFLPAFYLQYSKGQ